MNVYPERRPRKVSICVPTRKQCLTGNTPWCGTSRSISTLLWPVRQSTYDIKLYPDTLIASTFVVLRSAEMLRTMKSCPLPFIRARHTDGQELERPIGINQAMYLYSLSLYARISDTQHSQRGWRTWPCRWAGGERLAKSKKTKGSGSMGNRGNPSPLALQ